jgi:hypothetical protein
MAIADLDRPPGDTVVRLDIGASPWFLTTDYTKNNCLTYNPPITRKPLIW